jgi:hypothetical protein
MTLRPRNIVQAAEADIARRQRNMARHEGRLSSQMELYAFYAPHVRKARDAGHLMSLAIEHPTPGLESSKSNTRLIYGDLHLLGAALDVWKAENLITP